MQNKPLTDENPNFKPSTSPLDSPTNPLQGSSVLEPSSTPMPISQGEEYVIVEQKQSLRTLLLRRLPVALLLLLIVMGSVLVLTRQNSEITQVRADNFGTLKLLPFGYL